MFKRFLVLMTGLYVIGSSTSSVAQTTPVDWTPVFKSWENACEESSVLSKFLGDDRVPKGNRSALPEQLRNSVGKMKLVRDSQTFDYEFPITNGTYYGLPIEKFVQYVGDENGMFGNYIVLSANKDTAKKVLSRVKYKKISDEDGDYQVSISHKGNKTFLTCDFSQ